MNFETMELDELKEYAKSLGMTIGNIGKEKLIAKIKEKEEEKNTVQAVLNDEDIDEDVKETEAVEETHTPTSLLDLITSVIDDLEDSAGGVVEETVELPMDTQIPVKSLVFGGLTYKSRTTNAVTRWNQIGEVQYMTVAELNEMNNYKTDFLRNPLVILMDERAIKKFRLTSIYENVAKINNLNALFKSDLNTIAKTIDNALAVNMRDVLISKVRQMYKTKKLTDINVLKLLTEKLKFDIMDDNA